MRRVFGLLLLAGIAMVAAAWFAERPGAVSVVWQGWRIDTSFGVLALAVLAGCVTAALVYRFWRALIGAPRSFARWRRERRRHHGYAALTRGLVAVAAGDPAEARRHARRADVLLNEPPLTMLLSAQAAQLGGDEAEAKRQFTLMTARPETEFLGLRGLITQALKSGARDEALRLARRARELRPGTQWVQTTLFELETGAGDWRAAALTLQAAKRAGALSPALAQRHGVAVALARSHEAVDDDRPRDALAEAERAWKSAPDHPAVAPWLARRYLALGKRRSATRVVEQAWTRAPHPELAAIWAELRPADDALGGVRRAAALAGLAPAHRESQLLLARANLDAKLWGEARRHLAVAVAAAGDAPDVGICRLMARLEEEESGDVAAGHAWLARAAGAPPEPGWSCTACGAPSPEWRPTCGSCGAFDRIAWRAGGAPAMTLGVPVAATVTLPPG